MEFLLDKMAIFRCFLIWDINVDNYLLSVYDIKFVTRVTQFTKLLITLTNFTTKKDIL